MPLHSTTYFEQVGQGPDVVFIVGFGQDCTAWTFVVDQLKDEFRILLIDNRGCGRSSHPTEGYSVQDMADDVAELLAHLAMTDVHVVGQSMGGAIGQRLALTHPGLVARLLLLNSFARLDAVCNAALDGLYELLRHDVEIGDVVKCLVPWVYSSTFLATPGIIDEIAAAARANPYPQPLHSYRHQADALAEFDSTADLPAIAVPTLVVAGTEDRMTTMPDSEFLARSIPGAQLRPIPTGHGSHIERPDLVAAAVRDFMTS